MAVRAQQIALFGFDQKTLHGSVKVPQAEFFCAPVTMMKFEGCHACRVAAVSALAAACRDELGLPSLASFLL